MLALQEYFCAPSAVAHLPASLISRISGYREFETFDRLNSWLVDFDGKKDFALMEGKKVGAHDDGGKFWQPMLILENSRGAWTFRGSSQKVEKLDTQHPGMLVILDISRSHQVGGKSRSPWKVLCWNPSATVPNHSEYTLEEVREAAKSEFKRLIGATLAVSAEAARRSISNHHNRKESTIWECLTRSFAITLYQIQQIRVWYSRRNLWSVAITTM